MMKKPEVMYAWEHGFHKREVKKWINTQLARYRQDGFGFFAVTLKDTDRLIGQAGFFKAEIDGKEAVEVGFIFDNSVWRNGYCTEAAKACIELAFEQFKIEKLYCTVIPENEAAVKVAENLGMVKEGEYIKIYNEKEMRHLIYTIEKE
jgi:RimJ/RimL family protein N-acetyltransferase